MGVDVGLYAGDGKEPVRTYKTPEPFDIIEKPSHYNQGTIQPLDYAMDHKMSFVEGNVIKYVTRYKYKNGMEDLKKGLFYMNKVIQAYEEELKDVKRKMSSAT